MARRAVHPKRVHRGPLEMPMRAPLSLLLPCLLLAACAEDEAPSAKDDAGDGASTGDDSDPATGGGDGGGTGGDDGGGTGGDDGGGTGGDDGGGTGGDDGGTGEEPAVILAIDGGARAWADGSHARSCFEYRNPAAGYAYDGDAGSGLYRIDIGGSGTLLDLYCDMDGRDGGWTLVSQARPVPGPSPDLCTTDAAGALDADPVLVGGPGKLADVVINALWANGGGEREMRVDHDQDSTDTDRAAWDRQCVLDFADDHVWQTAVSVSEMTDLESDAVDCWDEVFFLDVVSHGNDWFCGHSFKAADNSFILTYTTVQAYPDYCGVGGDTVGTSMAGAPNYGCNVQKVYVR